MMMRPDTAQVEALLKETVTTLCKNGLPYSNQLHVQGLLGITLDASHVYIVQIDEMFGGHGVHSNSKPPAPMDHGSQDIANKHPLFPNFGKDSKFVIDSERLYGAPLQNSQTHYYLQNNERLERESSLETDASTVDSQYEDTVSCPTEGKLPHATKRRNSQSDTSSLSSQSHRRKSSKPRYRGPSLESRQNQDIIDQAITHNKEVSCVPNNYKTNPTMTDMYSNSEMDNIKTTYAHSTLTTNSVKSEVLFDDPIEHQSAYMTALMTKNRHTLSSSQWGTLSSQTSSTPNLSSVGLNNDHHVVNANIVPRPVTDMLDPNESMTPHNTSDISHESDGLMHPNIPTNTETTLNHSGSSEHGNGNNLQHTSALPISEVVANPSQLMPTSGTNSDNLPSTSSDIPEVNAEMVNTDGIAMLAEATSNDMSGTASDGSNIWSPAIMHHSSSNNEAAAAAVLSQLQGVVPRPVLLSPQQVAGTLPVVRLPASSQSEDIKPPLSPESLYRQNDAHITNSLSTQSSIQHTHGVPNNNKPYICTIPGCTRTFVHCRNLRQHETKVHGRVPPVIRRSIQSSNKPHCCPVGGCDKRFFHIQSIRRHIALCHMAQHHQYGYEIMEHTEKENLNHLQTQENNVALDNSM